MDELIQDLPALDPTDGPALDDPPAGDGRSVEVDTLTAPDWDRVIGCFDDLHLFQTAAFADGLRGEQRLSHLLVRRSGVPLAGARVAIMKPPGLPIGIAYVKYGPFWRRPGTAPDEAAYRAVVAAVVDEYAGRRGHMISVCPRPHPHFHAVEERLLAQAGFVLRGGRTRPLTFFLVNTGLGEGAMRASLSQTWRHNLKQAERKDLDIRFCEPMDALPVFHALHERMLARKKFVSRDPLHTLPRIFGQLPPGSSHIVTAAHQGEVVAAAVLILGGDVAYYLYGASDDGAEPQGRIRAALAHRVLARRARHRLVRPRRRLRRAAPVQGRFRRQGGRGAEPAGIRLLAQAAGARGRQHHVPRAQPGGEPARLSEGGLQKADGRHPLQLSDSPCRHGRTCSGHPCLCLMPRGLQDVDARVKPDRR